jgi:8-oxo-dGTP pyrophosphatase MutT (NUDIX family)
VNCSDFPILLLMFAPDDIRARLAQLETRGTRVPLDLDGFHKAGVLVPIVFGSVTPELLFTRRTDRVETHKGQVSFPGGMRDNEDADLTATALREAQEEVGIPPSEVRVVGMLDDFPTPTGFIITPVIGILDKLPRLVPNPDEVAETFLVPLSFFAIPGNGRKELREHRGKLHDVWFYDTAPHVIWGATAMIVRSLLHRLDLL